MEISMSKKIQDAEYKVNHHIYIRLLAIIMPITLGLFITFFYTLDCSEATAVLSAFISVFGGALASVLVAWLIDISNCTVQNKKLQITKNVILGEIISAISNFCICVYQISHGKSTDKKTTWLSWATKFFDNIESESVESKEKLISVTDSLLEETDRLIQQKLSLLAANIVTEMDAYEFSLIKSSLTKLKTELRQEKINKGHLIIIAKELDVHMSYSQLFNQYSKLEYNDELPLL